jgi:hypothetical protein
MPRVGWCSILRSEAAYYIKTLYENISIMLERPLSKEAKQAAKRAFNAAMKKARAEQKKEIKKLLERERSELRRLLRRNPINPQGVAKGRIPSHGSRGPVRSVVQGGLPGLGKKK